MNKSFKATILLSFVGLVAGCANPLNQATSIRYGEQCSKAEMEGRLDVAEQACYRALVNVDWGHLGDEQKSMRMYNLARVKRALGKFDEAEKLYKDSLSIEERQPQPSNEKIGRRLAELAMVCGQKEEYHTGLPYVERLYHLADIYQGKERKSVALVFYAYSQELQKKQPTELSKKLAAKRTRWVSIRKSLGNDITRQMHLTQNLPGDLPPRWADHESMRKNEKI